MAVAALIIDDSAAARKIIAYYLRKAGCTIVGEAENALRALELFRRLRPKVVTLDLMMPRIFGIDSAALLTTMKEEMPEVAVIVVSVVPFEKTRADFLARGVMEYVIKPLTDTNFTPVRNKLVDAFPELAAAPAGKAS